MTSFPCLFRIILGYSLFCSSVFSLRSRRAVVVLNFLFLNLNVFFSFIPNCGKYDTRGDVDSYLHNEVNVDAICLNLAKRISHLHHC